jgi:hypothetical protein
MRSERPCLILLTGYLPAVPADRPAEGRLPRHRTNLRRSRGFDFTMPACWNKCSLVCIASLDLHGGDPRMSVAPTIQHVDQVYAVVDSKGAHPDGAVSASWKRSATNYKIDPASDDPPRILTAYELTGYTLSISFIRLTRATVLDQVRLDVFQRRPAGSAKCRCLSKNECSLRPQLEETPAARRALSSNDERVRPPRDRHVWITTKPAFPALGAPMPLAGAHGLPSCRGFGIAKILTKRQLHPRQGYHPVDAGSKSSVAGEKGS